MNNQSNEKKIDLKYLFSRFLSKWYFFLFALLITLTLAYIHINLSPKIYAVNATILLENENAGNKATGELLEVFEAQKKEIEIEDQVGLITSYNMVQKAVERLDFGVSYFTVPQTIFNTFGDQIVEEKVVEQFPFRVVLDPSSNQLLNVPVYIRILSKNKYQVQVKEGQWASIYIIDQNKTIGDKLTPTINKIANLGEPFKNDNFNFKIFLNDGYEKYSGKKFYFIINNINNLTKTYQAKLVANPISRASRILQLQSTGPVIAKEVKFIDTLINVYLETDLIEKRQTSLKTIEFIDNQLKTVSAELAKASGELTNFRRSARTDYSAERSNVYENLETLVTQKSQINTNLDDINDILYHMESGKDLANSQPPSTVGIENPRLTDLIRNLDLLYQERIQLGLSHKKESPVYQQNEEAIANLRNSIIENLRNLQLLTNATLRTVEQRIAELQNNVSRIPENQIQLGELQNKREHTQEVRDFYLQKRAEAAILLATNAPSKKRVDNAKPLGGAPISPKTNAIYLIAFLIGVIIPAGSIIIYDLVNDTIKGKDDIKEATNIPVLGLIGHSDSKNGILAKTDNHKSALSEAFRSLRVNLQYLAAGMEHKSIGLTSAVSGEGKTFCSINLSTVLALSGKKTILIDADLRKPKVASYLGLKNSAGLSSFLIRNNSLEEIIQPTKIKNFDVITSGPIPPNPVELIEMKEMKELITKLKAEYDYIVIDTPPLSYVAEYMILKEYLDANIFVVRANYTKRDALETVNELYESKAINNLSIVINDVNLSSVYGKANGYYKTS